MKTQTRMQRFPTALAGGILAVALLVRACEVDTPTSERSDAPDGILEDYSVLTQAAADDPLIIVDGVIVSRQTMDELGEDAISPERIADIRILLGEAAVERYGERADAGVIEITTKDVSEPELPGHDGEETVMRGEMIYLPPSDEALELREIGPADVGTLEIAPPRSDDATREMETLEKLELLQGRISGARVRTRGGAAPGEGPSVRLRSRTNMSSSGPQPLIVVDGIVQVSSDIDLDAEEIAHIEVVRGSAASEEYGSRASAGVILITTHR